MGEPGVIAVPLTLNGIKFCDAPLPARPACDPGT